MKKLILIATVLITAVTFAQKATITKYPTEPIKIGTVVELEGDYDAGENQTVGEKGIAFVLRVFNTKTKKFVWKASESDETTKGINKGSSSASFKITKKIAPSSELKKDEEYRIVMTFKNSDNKWISNWKTVTII
ncbi:hypothetical protein SAMN06265371_101158 [Lutibacter agarilyticus]|uniref:DUF4625 domain-containing protein n=1 Tax=Lutibacter agarilyticus TaxID=1109740 RepID=A0A238VD06_9FLAO|nr:hypothetical protein [Lutibacter agarilyticus]SNR31573.1 hypothetical protein SAMN06265371_101158 [Lutibacter agarilyticus]